MKQIVFGKMLFFVLMLLGVQAYSAENDYSLVAACINGCRGNAAAYSKLSKAERDKAEEFIKIYINACMESSNKTSGNDKIVNPSENDNRNTDVKAADNSGSKNYEDIEEDIYKDGSVFYVGAGGAVPLRQYAYTGAYDIGYGNIGGTGFVSI